MESIVRSIVSPHISSLLYQYTNNKNILNKNMLAFQQKQSVFVNVIPYFIPYVIFHPIFHPICHPIFFVIPYLSKKVFDIVEAFIYIHPSIRLTLYLHIFRLFQFLTRSLKILEIREHVKKLEFLVGN